MDTDLLHYISGEDVQTGDRIQYRGKYGTVVFVSNGESEEFAPGFEDYIGSDRGVVICDDDGDVTQLGDPDELLSFIGRG